MKTFRVVARIYNNLLRERREQAGMSAPKFCEAAGLHYSEYCKLESLKESPLTSGKGKFGKIVPITWRPIAMRIASYWGVTPEELWPVEARAVVKNKTEMRLDAEEMVALLSVGDSSPPPSMLLEDVELSAALASALGSLTERERFVIAARCGLEEGKTGPGRTLDEIADVLGLSRERARQIEQRALRKLRHPARSKSLREAAWGDL